MKYLSEREEQEDIARLELRAAQAAFNESIGSGILPEVTDLDAAVKKLAVAQSAPHFYDCVTCREEFNPAETQHYVIIIYALIGPDGKIIADIPTGVKRLAICLSCAEEKQFLDYINKR